MVNEMVNWGFWLSLCIRDTGPSTENTESMKNISKALFLHLLEKKTRKDSFCSLSLLAMDHKGGATRSTLPIVQYNAKYTPA